MKVRLCGCCRTESKFCNTTLLIEKAIGEIERRKLIEKEMDKCDTILLPKME